MSERVLSIFLSGTRKDLKVFWARAQAALAEAFPEYNVSSMEGAEPEDIPGDHWSRREAARPDVVVGLIGHYYGYIPAGQQCSVTEQEFDVAGQMGIERLVFLTETGEPVELGTEAAADRARADALRSKVDPQVVRREVKDPDDFAHHVVEAVRLWEVRTLRGATRDAETHFAPLLDKGRALNHAEPLVGHADTLGTVSAFLESGRKVLVLHAPWGRGKSRVLLELGRRDKKLVRFLSTDAELTRFQLGVSPQDRMLLVVEDLQAWDDRQLRPLLSFLHRCSADVKLIVASRSTRVSEFDGLCHEQGIADGAIERLELRNLTDTERHELIGHIVGGQNDVTSALAARTRGNVLAAVVGAQLLKRGESLSELEGSPDFEGEVLKRFTEALIRASGIDLGARERLERALQVVAIASPIRPADVNQRDALARFVNVSAEQFVRDLGILESLGLLLRVGGLVTVPVEAIRETVAVKGCVNAHGELTGLGERALKELTEVFRRNVLRNLARVDWWNGADGTSTNLLDLVWPELERAYGAMPAYQRLQLLRDLEDVGLFSPRGALSFVEHALPSGLGPPETDEVARTFGPPKLEHLYDRLAVILRGVLRHPAFVSRACDLLWQMAEHDRRGAAQHTDCAERTILDLARLEPHRPLASYGALLDWLEASLAAGRLPGYRASAYVRPLLAKEMEHGYWDEEALHLWADGVSPEKVKPIHDRVLAILARIITRGDVKAAAAAIGAMAEAVFDPPGAYGRRPKEAELKGWSREQLYVVGLLSTLADRATCPVLYASIASALEGPARLAAVHEVKVAARGALSLAVAKLKGTVEAALLPAWCPPWGPGQGAEQRRAAGVMSIARNLLGDGCSPDESREKVLQADSLLSAAGFNSDAGAFLHAVTLTSQPHGESFFEWALENDGPAATYAGAVVDALWSADATRGRALLKAGVERGGAHLRHSIACGLCREEWRVAVGGSDLVGHWQTLLQSAEVAVRLKAIHSIWLAKELPVRLRLGLVLPYDPSKDQGRHEVWCFALLELYGEITAEERRAICARLGVLQSLGYHEEELLDRLVKDEPAAVIDALLERVVRAASVVGEFEAVPRGNVGTWVATFPEPERERGLTALGQLLGGRDYRTQAAAQELFALLGQGHSEVVRRVRLTWAQSSESADILAAADSFRREAPSSLIEEEEVVAAILMASSRLGEEVLRSAKSKLLSASAGGVRTGGVEDVVAPDLALRDAANQVAARRPPGSVVEAFYQDLARHAEACAEHFRRHVQERVLED